MKISSHKRSQLPKSLSLVHASVFTLFLLGGCATDVSNLASFGKVDWFKEPKDSAKATLTLAGDPNALADDGNIQTAIHNAVALTNQKRFAEARHILAEVREIQDPEEDGYRAVTCAMALLALREGRIETFKRTARQLDLALGEPINVPSSYVQVISLYRVLSNKTLPVNVPDGVKRLKDRHFPMENAKL
jgi:hypothetical protein